MKLVTTLLVAVAAGLAIYAARRRIKLALATAAIVYLILLPVRLLFFAGDLGDRLDELVGPAVAVLMVWLVLRQVSLAYQRRRRASGRPRTPRLRR